MSASPDSSRSAATEKNWQAMVVISGGCSLLNDVFCIGIELLDEKHRMVLEEGFAVVSELYALFHWECLSHFSVMSWIVLLSHRLGRRGLGGAWRCRLWRSSRVFSDRHVKAVVRERALQNLQEDNSIATTTQTYFDQLKKQWGREQTKKINTPHVAAIYSIF